MKEEKIKPTQADVAKQLQKSIENISTLPKYAVKITEKLEKHADKKQQKNKAEKRD
jgi:hypothetical protein